MVIKNIKEIDYSRYMVKFLPDGMTKCVVCNNEFKSYSTTHKYCSDFCQNRRPRKPKPGKIDKICLHCGEQFKANREWSKWCSKICASRGRNKAYIRKDSPTNVKRDYKLGEDNCLNCNAVYTKQTYRHKYCCGNCKKDHTLKFKKQESLTSRQFINCKICGVYCKPKRKDSQNCGKSSCVSEWRKRGRLKRDNLRTKREQQISIGNCPTCNKEFFSNNKTRFKRHIKKCKLKTCSIPGCGKKFFSARAYTRSCGCKPVSAENAKGYPKQKECAHCNKTFDAKSYKNIYCSENCRKNTPKAKLCHRIRRGVRHSLKYNCIKKDKKSWDMLDFTLGELFLHLNKQFVDGMGWHNMDKWHIDHIIPIAAFDFDSDFCSDFKACWSLGNLRPMWAEDNLKKGDKIPGVDYI